MAFFFIEDVNVSFKADRIKRTGRFGGLCAGNGAERRNDQKFIFCNIVLDTVRFDMYDSFDNENKFVCIKETFLVYPVILDISIINVFHTYASGSDFFVVAQTVRYDNHNAFFLLFMVFSIVKNQNNNYNYIVRRVKCQ